MAAEPLYANGAGSRTPSPCPAPALLPAPASHSHDPVPSQLRPPVQLAIPVSSPHSAPVSPACAPPSPACRSDPVSPCPPHSLGPAGSLARSEPSSRASLHSPAEEGSLAAVSYENINVDQIALLTNQGFTKVASYFLIGATLYWCSPRCSGRC